MQRFDLRSRLTPYFFLLCFGLLPLPLTADNSQEKLKAIEGQISGLNSALASDQSTRKTLLNELASSEKAIGKLAQQVRQLQNEQQDIDQQLTHLNTEKNRLQQSLMQLQYQLRQLLRSAYANGRQEKLKLFLNQQDPSSVNRIMTYYDYLNRQRIQRIEEARQVLGQLNNTSAQIEVAATQLDDNLSQQDQQLAKLKKNQLSRNRLVKNLDSAIKSKQQKLQQLEQDRQALGQVLQQISQQQKAKQQERQTPIGRLRGKLPWPLAGTIRYRFGQERTGDLNWDGVLIDAPLGQEVRAIHYGRVVYADWLRGYGLLIIIDHGDGIISLYGHNQSLFKEVGEWIDKHDVIAEVGQSGGLQQAGLYFSIRKKGSPNNPKRWCKKTRANKTSI